METFNGEFQGCKELYQLSRSVSRESLLAPAALIVYSQLFPEILLPSTYYWGCFLLYCPETDSLWFFYLFPWACMLSRFSHIWLFATLWIVAHQASLSMGFSRQEYWRELPCPPPGDPPNLGIEPRPPRYPALAGWFFTISTTWVLNLSPNHIGT